jgi:hypothetical protein
MDSRYSKRIRHLFVKQKTRHAIELQHQTASELCETQQKSSCVYSLKSDILETRKQLGNLNCANWCM